MFANGNSLPARFVRLALSVTCLLSVFGPGAAAESDSLSEAVHSLAIEFAASRTLRGPYRLVCQNHSSVPASRTVVLFEEFRSQLAVVPNLLTDNSSAPVIRLTLEETPSRIVILLRTPAPEGEQVRLLEVDRASIALNSPLRGMPYIVQRLLWRQNAALLAAAERNAAPRQDSGSMDIEKLLLVLDRGELRIYREAPAGPALQSSTRLPGTPVPSRLWSGAIYFSGPGESDFTLEIPGRTCTGSLAENPSLHCGPPSLEGKPLDARTPRREPAIELAAPCDRGSWVLTSGEGDHTTADRLMLGEKSGVAQTIGLEMPGPVLSLGPSTEPQSAVASVFNLATGEYEIYRLTLACGN